MWIYNEKPIEKLEDLPENCVGFIYIILNKTNGKKYLGKKILHHKKTLKPLKRYKRKRHLIKESDWYEYSGSNELLNEDISKGDEIEKYIIHLCYSKKQMSYYEVKYQFLQNVLEDDTYYNSNILGKFFKRDI